MRAIFRICGNESQQGLQLIGKLATPLITTFLFQGRAGEPGQQGEEGPEGPKVSRTSYLFFVLREIGCSLCTSLLYRVILDRLDQ